MTNNKYLANESIIKLMLKFSIPSICALLVSSLYNIVDQIFIGQGIGYLANGATNVVFPLVTIATAFSLLVGDGSAAYLSICQGQGDTKRTNKVIGNSMTMVLGISFLLVILFTIFNEHLLWFLGGTNQNIHYAKEYFHIILIGFPFFMYTSAMNSVIRANGSPNYSMLATVIGCVINVILDPIAIFVLKMGISGAALATIVGQIVTAICCFCYFKRNVTLHKNDFVLDTKIIKKSLPLGLSSFFTQAFIIIITTVLNNALVKYGALSKFGEDIPLTVVGIVMKVYQIVISFVVGIAAGIQPIIGYNYGAGLYHRVKSTFKTMLLAEMTVGLIATFIFELFPMEIIQLFGSESALYNEFAMYAFRVYFSTIVLCCFQKSTSIFLQAFGKPMLSMGLSLLRDFIISVVSVYVASYFFGVYGPVLSAPISDVLSFIAVVLLWKYLFKTFKNLENNKKD